MSRKKKTEPVAEDSATATAVVEAPIENGPEPKNLPDYVDWCLERLPPEQKHEGLDLVYFSVRRRPGRGDAATLRRLIDAHVAVNAPLNIFDGQWHRSIAVGLWLGNEGRAIAMMALGEMLGLWVLDTPVEESKKYPNPTREAYERAAAGLILIKAAP